MSLVTTACVIPGRGADARMLDPNCVRAGDEAAGGETTPVEPEARTADDPGTSGDDSASETPDMED